MRKMRPVYVTFRLPNGFVPLLFATAMTEAQIRAWVLTRYPEAKKVTVA